MKGPLPEQAPLSITWREWLAGPDWDGEDYRGEPFDAIVIGSGYGGSVAALRLGEKGHRVLLLERGSEYLPGEFPNDFSVAPKSLRVNVPTAQQPVGRASGLVEIHLGQGYVAVSGNGLGGGSLVNAGVAIEPDSDVFAQPEWPAALRHGLAGGLEPRHFDDARAMLRATRWDSTLPGGGRIGKTAALERLAEALDGTPRPLDLTIDPARCVRCGDCASGCNVPGAKLTLSLTYLAAAVRTRRVTVVTQAEVYRFAPNAPQHPDLHRWQVHAFATDAQQQFTATAHVQKEPQPSGTWRIVQAPMLFVCAGTLGSTQLLQRSQARSRGRLAFSQALGTRVSGNGDSLSWVVDEEAPMSSIGRGEPGRRAWDDLPAQPFEASKIVGPTITAAIDLRKGQKLTERLLVQDGAVPRAIAQVARELLATAHTLRQLDDWWFRTPRHATAAREDPLAASAQRAQQSQVLLTMGHDGSPARLVWIDATDRSAPYLAQPEKIEGYAVQQQAFDRLGDRHVHNPLWRPLPRTATQLMDGELPPTMVTTVHPLGGCVMGDDPATSVVDDLGRVWARDPGAFSTPVTAVATDSAAGDPYGTTNRPHRYRGLHVLDGSIVPTSLGCNPLLTITALAERAMQAIEHRKPPRDERDAPRSAPRAPQPFPSEDVRVDAKLHETLLCRELALDRDLADTFGTAPLAARFDATFPTRDLLGTMTAARHRFRIEGRLLIGPQQADPAMPPVHYEVQRGRFELLPAPWLGTGPWPLLSALAQAAATVLLVRRVGALAGWPAAALLSIALVVALPFWRSLLTWIVTRGASDIWQGLRDGKRRSSFLAKLLPWTASLLKQMVQAGEKRVMTYRATLRRVGGPASWPETLVFTARKRVSYRASVLQVIDWLRRREHTAIDGSRERVRIRETFWEQVMDAHVRITPSGFAGRWQTVASGRFRMGPENLIAFGGDEGCPPPPIELGRSGDTSSGLLAAAAYPLLFLRFGLKTRILDFRLPAYSGIPRADRIAPQDNTIRNCDPPDLLPVDVERGTSSNDQGQESAAPVRLSLLRYRTRRADRLPELVAGDWLGVPVVRAKSVLLVHAFGNSGHTFTLQSVPRNLAESFHAAGYEVWVLDLRMSTRSASNAEPSTVDQLAQYDIPAAVDAILARLREDFGPHAPAEPLQIAAFGHCIGSAALWMSLLDGCLSHGKEALHPGAGGAKLSKLSHAMFSQLHPWVVGARLQQAKTWVPALLQKAWDRGTIPFAVRGEQKGLVLSVMDRVFRSMPAPRAEDRRPDGNDDASATSRRIRYIDAQVFRHEHIADATLGEMNRIFGDANMRLFGHARRFIERGMLVSEDGYNLCVAQDNFRRHAALPVQLLHGQDNQLFDVAGAELTFRRLAAVQGGWQARYCRDAQGRPGFLRMAGYGHLDVLIGQSAHQDVFPHVVGFFDRVLRDAAHDQRCDVADEWVVRPPALGPFVGWTRRSGPDLLVRVSFMLDAAGTQAEAALQVRLRARAPGASEDAPYSAWQGPAVRWHPQKGPFRFFVGDIRVPHGMPVPEDWELLLLRPAWGDPPLADGLQASDAAITAFMRAVDQAQSRPTVVPPVDASRIVFERARFRLPAATIATLDDGAAFSFAVGSCRHPGLGLDRERIDDPLRQFLDGGERVAFAALLGDQIYADATAGFVDPLSPLERYHERHEKAFARGRLGDLLAAMPVYMTPDDHEWTDNYPAASPLVRRPWPRGPVAGSHAEPAERHAFAMATAAVGSFQRLQGPGGARLLRTTPLGVPARPLPWFRFDHGCARFFVIDSRLTRSRTEPRLVDDFKALECWLRAAKDDGRVHVVASGSVVLPGLRPNADPANPGVSDTWQYAEAQRRELLDLLLHHVPGRFVLLAADYHVSGAVRLEVGGRTVGAAIVAPPLYAPLAYANSTPESVFTGERLQLAGGELVMQGVPGGEFARGSGLGVVDLRPADDGRVDLRYRRRLWVWEQGRAARPQDALVARLGP